MLGAAPRHASAVGRFALAFVVAALLSACLPRRSTDNQQGAGPPLLQPAASAQGAMTLKFSHLVGKNTPKGKAAEKFGELVREKSGGKIDVQVFANAELYRDADEMDALQQGSIQFIAPGNGKFGSVAPAWDALGLPYLLTSDAAINKLMDPENQVARELFDSLGPKGPVGLAIWANGWKHFINSKRPLRIPDDFQGLRIGMTNKPDKAFARALGASAQTMATPEIFVGIQQDNLDGTYHTWSNILAQKFHEIQKYATISRGGEFLTYGVITNAAWWDSLHPDVRKTLGDALKETSVYERQLSDKENADALAEIKKSNRLEFHEQSEDDVRAFQKAAADLTGQLENKVGKDIIAKLRARN